MRSKLFSFLFFQTGWSTWFANAVFWILVLGAKIAFDWFAVMKTMKLGVQALNNASWLGAATYTTYTNP